MNLILKDSTFIDAATLVFRSGDILVRPGESPRFLAADEKIDFEKGDCKVMDCSGKLVTRSFVNAHHHVYSALSRGMAPPPEPPGCFREVLRNIWWILDRAHDEETIRASALYTAMECARNGVTFVIDHHASPEWIEGSLELIAESFEQAGLSHLLCYEVTGRGGKERAGKGLEETERYLEKRQGLVGLHASFTVDPEIMKKAVVIAEKYHTGLHIHVAEDLFDQEHSLRQYGIRVVDRLQSAGVLNFPQTILVHCLHIDENERKLLREAKAYIVQNAESNLNNRVGLFDREGLPGRIMLGTDGMHSDMLRSSKAAFFTGRLKNGVSPGEIYNRLRMAHQYLSLNGFGGDGENNLVVLDYPSPTPVTGENFLSHFIFGIESKHVRHVISNGRLVIEDRRLTTLDEDEVRMRAVEASKALWSRMETIKRSGDWKKY